jgi:hypothetical protein
MATTLKHMRWADLAVGVAIFVLAAMTGCAAQPAGKSGATVANLPAPSFDGPNIVKRSAVAGGAQASKPHPFAPSGPADWKPRAPARDWKWIVIHHSATPTGSMNFFDKEHRAKGWDGVGYHFVIGNGTSTGDGQVETTPRWPAQKWGAHAKTVDNRYNEQGIGICLVGNFDVERPSPNQMKNLSRLVSYLMQTYRIAPQNVIGHRDTKATECPGKFVNLASVRSSAVAAMSDRNARAAAEALESPSLLSSAEPSESPLSPSSPLNSAQTASGRELLTDVGR